MELRDNCVKTWGFDKVLAMYEEIHKVNPTLAFSSRGSEVLNELMVNITIHNMTFIEFLTLKNITKSILILDTKINKYYYPENGEEVFSILSKLNNDVMSNASNINDPLSLLPINAFTLDVSASFSGTQLLLFSSGTIDSLLMKNNKLLTLEEVEKGILDSFPAAFFSFMNKFLSGSDFVSELMVNSMVYDYCDKGKSDSLTVVRVRGTNDIIQFSGGDEASISSAFKNMKETRTIQDASMVLSCYSNLSTYAQFVLYSDYVTGNVPLRNLLGLDKFGVDPNLMSTHKNRIVDVMKKFMVERHKTLSDPKYSLIKYCWLLCSDKINYELTIPLRDVESIENINRLADNHIDSMIKEIKKVQIFI